MFKLPLDMEKFPGREASPTLSVNSSPVLGVTFVPWLLKSVCQTVELPVVEVTKRLPPVSETVGATTAGKKSGVPEKTVRFTLGYRCR